MARDTPLRRPPTTADILDHVLDKGVVVETRPEDFENTLRALSIVGILAVNTRVVTRERE